MKYKVYYLNFNTPIHIGKGNLDDAEYTICADTFFSALCIEALKIGGEKYIDKLVGLVRNNQLLMTDLMPHIKKEMWIYKPFLNIKHEEEGDSIVKKNFKKLRFIPISQVKLYAEGKLNPEIENKKMKELGKSVIETKATMCEKDEATPYTLGTFRFDKGNGLYVIMGADNSEAEQIFDELIYSLGFTGVGGHVSSGLGKFTYEKGDLTEDIASMIGNSTNQNILLTTSVAREDELESVVESARYKLVKRGGFIQSFTYSDTFMKKKAMHMFQSGSVFSNIYEGEVYNVGGKGSHPVYKYSKPIFCSI